MSLNPKLSDIAANAEVNALAALFDGGFLDLFDGVQPATADTALSGQTLLASLGFGTPAFGGGVAGVAAANPITADADADASGTATWYRCFESDHATVIQDGSVGLNTSNLNMVNNVITIHTAVTVSSFVLTAQKG
jgi:hypothetical protein